MRRPALLLSVLALAAGVIAAGDIGVGRLLVALGRPDAAALAFRDPAWRGVALLEAGRPDEAVAELRRTGSREAAYNLGNAFARLGRYGEAVRAYELALLRDPEDADARANKALVEAALAAETRRAAARQNGLSNAGATIDHRSGRDDVAGDDTGAQSSTGDGMVGNRESGSESRTAGSGKVGRAGAGQEDETDQGEGSGKGSATDAGGTGGSGGGPTDMAESADERRLRRQAEMQEATQATLQWLAAIPDDPARFLKLRIAAERDRRVAAGTAVQPGGPGW